MIPDYKMPRAFIGYGFSGKTGAYIRCCSTCPDKAQLEAWAARGPAPLPVTHGICPACYQTQMARLMGEADDLYGRQQPTPARA